MSSTEKTIGRTRDEMAQRAAQDIPDGAYVNLGIGIPELVAAHVPEGREFIYHTENGLLGMGPAPPAGEEDPELINAGKQAVTALQAKDARSEAQAARQFTEHPRLAGALRQVARTARNEVIAGEVS